MVRDPALATGVRSQADQDGQITGPRRTTSQHAVAVLGRRHQVNASDRVIGTDSIVVDLPEPFGPRNPVTVPGRTVNLRRSQPVPVTVPTRGGG